MRRYLIATFALAGLALAAGAVPAFTADSGTINLSVTAQAPPAPCVEFAHPPGTQVGFGTHAFSTASQGNGGRGDVAPKFSNCSTATETLYIAGTDAQSAGHTWSLEYINASTPCPALNQYLLYYSMDGFGGAPITKTNASLLNLKTAIYPSTWPAGEQHDLGLSLVMPCQGSDGAGEAFSFNVTLTAAIA